MNIEENIFALAIEKATRKTAEKLFQETGESFYYFTLITTGEAHSQVGQRERWRLMRHNCTDRQASSHKPNVQAERSR